MCDILDMYVFFYIGLFVRYGVECKLNLNLCVLILVLLIMYNLYLLYNL